MSEKGKTCHNFWTNNTNFSHTVLVENKVVNVFSPAHVLCINAMESRTEEFEQLADLSSKLKATFAWLVNASSITMGLNKNFYKILGIDIRPIWHCRKSPHFSSQSSPTLNKVRPWDKSGREALWTSQAAKCGTFQALKPILDIPGPEALGQVLPWTRWRQVRP